ncbi:F-box domain-containing protein [Mycena indigotica]|uniref:F-box domain-containing protein n=1 Tax=Mycena indigotica TaxID=2126181 RepID=A0A8H6SWQ1_9AGAR|nr:F-box domain-containing protein [Mycena indigotica]KAF7306217.1 F-box domain-containing protein [Mycena indigotica]
MVHSPPSLFATLPLELITEILSYCSNQCIEIHSDTSRTALQSCQVLAGGELVLLAQTCHWVRRVVRSTPTLWNTIIVDLRCFRDLPEEDLISDPRSEYNWMLSLLNQVLGRGRNSPRRIELYSPYGLHPRHFIQILTLWAAHWHNIRFSMNNDMLDLLQGVSFPSLKSLSLQLPYKRRAARAHSAIRQPGYSLDFLSTQYAPRLSFLSIFGALPSIDDLAPLLSTFVCSLRYADMPFILKIVPHLTSAAGLDLAVLSSFNHDVRKVLHSDGALFHRRVTSTLGKLSITQISHHSTWDSDGNAVGVILDSLALPELSSFRISASRTPVVWPHVSGLAFLQRSGQSLTSLDLVTVCLSTAQLLAVLGAVPLLTSLYIRDNADSDVPALVTDDLFVAVKLHQPALVPALSGLSIGSRAAFTTSALMQLLQHRQEAQLVVVLYWLAGYGTASFQEDVEKSLDEWDDQMQKREAQGPDPGGHI